jgi:hypothetical protein
MPSIICDTNVWYNLGSGVVDIKSIDRLKLIGTAVTVQEFSYTPNLINHFEDVKKAISAFLSLNSGINILNPFEYLLYLFIPGYIPSDSKIRGLIEELKILQTVEFTELSRNNIEIGKSLINEKIKFDRDFSDSINSELINIQDKFKNKKLRNEHKNKDFSIEWKNLISDIVKLYSKHNYAKEYCLSDDPKIWNRIECFILVWETYFKLLDTEKRKIDKNDWSDLINLVYVNPGDKYWTFEKKWNYVLNCDKRLHNYLYKFNNT